MDRPSFTLTQAGEPLRARFQAQAVTVNDQLVQKPDFSCPDLIVKSNRVQCRKAALHLTTKAMGKVFGVMDFNHGMGAVDFDGKLAVKVLDDKVAVRAEIKSKGNMLVVEGDAKASVSLLEPYLEGFAALSPQGDGQVSWIFTQIGEHSHVSADVSFVNGSFSDVSGLKAGEKLQLDAHMEARGSLGAGEGLFGDFTMSGCWRAGEAIWQSLYMPAGSCVHLWGHGDPDTLFVDEGELFLPGVPPPLKLAGSFPLRDGNKGMRWQVMGRELPLQQVYARYAKAFAPPLSLAASLTLDGALDVAVRGEGQVLQEVGVTLKKVHVADGAGRMQLVDVDGKGWWEAGGAAHDLRLSWREGRFYNIPLGKTSIEGTMAGLRVSLARPAEIPVLDGGLRINALDLAYSKAGPEGRLQLTIRPIDLAQLTEVLGWPKFSGNIALVAPDVQVHGAEIRIQGTASVSLFDGKILVKGLHGERLFGDFPALNADLEVQDLNLEKVTKVFDVGKIVGVLAGEVAGLRLENWEPAAFQADLHTVRKDGIRQRISQKAVENLSRIGQGGVSAALQKTFLGFFEEFSYDALGIKVALQGEVAEIGGVRPAKQGFYILKGSGLPQVNIVGYNRQIEWRTLVASLKSAVEKGAVQVGSPQVN